MQLPASFRGSSLDLGRVCRWEERGQSLGNRRIPAPPPTYTPAWHPAWKPPSRAVTDPTRLGLAEELSQGCRVAILAWNVEQRVKGRLKMSISQP